MDPIELKLYRHEAYALHLYLMNKRTHLKDQKGTAPDQDFVLVEWLMDKYLVAYVRIERAKTRSAKTVKMPVSVARILWKSWQQELISPPLQLVLQGIDGELKNKNLTPL